MSQPNMIKLSQTVWRLRPAQDFGFRGDKYITKKKKVSLLHMTPLLVLTYVSTNFIKIFQTIKNFGVHKNWA